MVPNVYGQADVFHTISRPPDEGSILNEPGQPTFSHFPLGQTFTFVQSLDDFMISETYCYLFCLPT